MNFNSFIVEYFTESEIWRLQACLENTSSTKNELIVKLLDHVAIT